MEFDDFYFQHVLQKCLSPDIGQRTWALDELGKEFLEKVEGSFLLLLLRRATAHQEQSAILGIMGQIGTRAPLQALIDILTDREASSWISRSSVANTLTALGKDAPIEVFITLLQDPTEEVGLREEIAYSLGGFGERVPLEVLLKAVADSEPAVCAAAIQSLITHNPHTPLEPILAHVNDSEWYVRKSAIQALSSARERAPVEPIVTALRDQDERVREAAIKGLDLLLEWFGQRVPLDPLIAALKDEHATVRESCLDAFANHPEIAPLDQVVEALSDQNPYVRCAALVVVQNMGRDRVPETVDQTLQEMASTELHVNARKYAMKTLFLLKGIPPGKAHDSPGEYLGPDDYFTEDEF